MWKLLLGPSSALYCRLLLNSYYPQERSPANGYCPLPLNRCPLDVSFKSRRNRKRIQFQKYIFPMIYGRAFTF